MLNTEIKETPQPLFLRFSDEENRKNRPRAGSILQVTAQYPRQIILIHRSLALMDLPVEILLYILSFLDTESLLIVAITNKDL